jgi:hypothetical protein
MVEEKTVNMKNWWCDNGRGKVTKTCTSENFSIKQISHRLPCDHLSEKKDFRIL